MMRSPFGLLFLIALSFLSRVASNDEVKLTFHNELPEDIEVFWVGEGNVRQSQFIVKAGGDEGTIYTHPEHLFSYEFDGHEHYVQVPHGQPEAFAVLFAGRETPLMVRCTMKDEKKKFNDNNIVNINIYPAWSPRGAARFLDLVREKYFDGIALNRVVPHFLTQFGISADYQQRTDWRNKRILDDPPTGVPFVPGTMSYAGSGPNSRSTEIFTVMPGTPQHQLDYFGTNVWETPFGIIENVEDSPVAKWFWYGDMPPWGKGPDPQKIYLEDGYDYLAQNFPQMDYLETCVIVDNEEEEEEL